MGNGSVRFLLLKPAETGRALLVANTGADYSWLQKDFRTFNTKVRARAAQSQSWAELWLPGNAGTPRTGAQPGELERRAVSVPKRACKRACLPACSV